MNDALFNFMNPYPLQPLVVVVIPCQKKLRIAWDFHAADSLNCRSCYYIVLSRELVSPQHRINNNRSSKQTSSPVICLLWHVNTLGVWITLCGSWLDGKMGAKFWSHFTQPVLLWVAFSYSLHFLKVLTNEKRGGFILVPFDWSRFRLFKLKFSIESVQTPSCERPKTAQRTLFLSFEINNCFPITVLHRRRWKNPQNLHATWSIQTSVLIHCRHSKYRYRIYCVIWKDLWWRADSFRRFKYRGGSTIPLFQLTVWCEKGDAARHCTVIGWQLLISNDRNRVRWAVLGLSQDGACTDLFENLRVNSLKGDLSNATTFNPPLFSLVNTFNNCVKTKTNISPLLPHSTRGQ